MTISIHYDDEEKSDLRVKVILDQLRDCIKRSRQKHDKNRRLTTTIRLQSGGQDLDLNLEYKAERTPTLAEEVELDDRRTGAARPVNATRRQESVNIREHRASSRAVSWSGAGELNAARRCVTDRISLTPQGRSPRLPRLGLPPRFAHPIDP